MRNDDQVFHGYQTRREEKFLQGRPRRLRRDLVVIANVVV